MYLIITEDLDVKRMDSIDEEVLDVANDGIIDLIRIDGPLPMRYIDGEWIPVEKI